METFIDIPPPTEENVIPVETHEAPFDQLIVWFGTHFKAATFIPQSRDSDPGSYEWDLETNTGLKKHFEPGTLVSHVAEAAFQVLSKT